MHLMVKLKLKVTGTVTKKDGSAPDGKIEVELPTTMSFSVDQKGNFSAGDFKVTNHSSTDIQVSVSGFMDLTPTSGITVFSVDQKGNFSAGDFKVTNHSSTDIQVSVSGFMDLTPTSGITVKPIGEEMSNLDRSNLNLALFGNTGYIDLGSRIDSETVILEV